MTQLTDKVYAVEVPDGAKLLHTEVDLKEMPYLAYKFKEDELLNEYELIYLQPGLWRFLFTTKTATEEDARKVVEEFKLREHIRYEDYTREYMWQETAVESMQSLLRSKGLDGKNYALIEKQSSDDRR